MLSLLLLKKLKLGDVSVEGMAIKRGPIISPVGHQRRAIGADAGVGETGVASRGGTGVGIVLRGGDQREVRLRSGGSQWASRVSLRVFQQ